VNRAWAAAVNINYEVKKVEFMQCELRLGGGCNGTRKGMWNIVIYIYSQHVYHNILLNSFRHVPAVVALNSRMSDIM
jgi:hypothetical protein